MNRHLGPAEFVDAIEGTLKPSRTRHLDACAACRREAGRLSAVLERAAAGETCTEPPAPFWTELSQRVREAVAAEPTPRRRLRDWLPPRPLQWALPGCAAAAALVFTVWHGAAPAPASHAGAAAPAVSAGAGAATRAPVPERGADENTDGGWSFVLNLADEASADALDEAGVALGPESIEHLTFTLTDRERLELVRLVEAAMELPEREPAS